MASTGRKILLFRLWQIDRVTFKPEFFGGQATDTFPVHGEVDGSCGGNHPIAFCSSFTSSGVASPQLPGIDEVWLFRLNNAA